MNTPCRILVLSAMLELIASAAASQVVFKTERENRYHVDPRLAKAAPEMVKAVHRFTPEDEHSIGRAAAAMLLEGHRIAEDQAAQRYLALVGRSVTITSRYPDAYAGYHFILLDSEEPQAYAFPGAYVFVTRGLLRLASDEDMLAAILAHELAHVQQGHGLQMIKNRHWKRFLRILGKATVEVLSEGLLRDLTPVLDSLAGDYFVVLTLRGYSRELEDGADSRALHLLERAGYDPSALVDVLERLKDLDHRSGVTSTHRDPKKRLKAIRKALVDKPRVSRAAARKQRFAEALGRLLTETP